MGTSLKVSDVVQYKYTVMLLMQIVTLENTGIISANKF